MCTRNRSERKGGSQGTSTNSSRVAGSRASKHDLCIGESKSIVQRWNWIVACTHTTYRLSKKIAHDCEFGERRITLGARLQNVGLHNMDSYGVSHSAMVCSLAHRYPYLAPEQKRIHTLEWNALHSFEAGWWRQRCSSQVDHRRCSTAAQQA